LLGRKNDDGDLRDTEFWALRQINISLHRGEVLGVLGQNGAGKSTLLKCIAGQIMPDRGKISLYGHMSHLLDMSAGFAPKMTGRTNIKIRGQLMGKSGKDLKKYISSVREFADIDEFFDAPVQFYSSGMKSRLGFAASSVIDPDILIIDEALAVGDLAFRLRCYERINELTRNAAVIYVSHSLGQIARLCTKAAFLEKGRMLFQGDVQEAISRYRESQGVRHAAKKVTVLNPELTSLRLLVEDKPFEPDQNLPYGCPLKLDVDVSNLPGCAQVRVLLKDESQTLLMDWNSGRENLIWPRVPTFLRIDLGKAELAPGTYSLSVQVMSSDGRDHICLSEPVTFRLNGDQLFANPVQRLAEWEFLE
jgi:lipopolysaccharide transport system ATP-binding protein